MENNQLALRIRAFRKLKGMTQTELSDRLDVSVAVLGAIERGVRKPDDHLIMQICSALQIERDELLKGLRD